MDEDIIIQEEQSQFEEFPLLTSQETEAYTQVRQVSYEDIDISTPIFTGFGLAGTMCLITLGINLVLRYFKIA